MFQQVNADILQKSSKMDKIGLQGFPTVCAFDGEDMLDSLVGNQGEKALSDFIEKHS